MALMREYAAGFDVYLRQAALRGDKQGETQRQSG